jgi:hypothetical protein
MAGLLNPLTAIAGPESSFGQNLQNPNSTASGLYGFINSTWQTNLKAIGGDTVLYPTAKSAPNSVQSAVAAHVYNTRGFADWTCPGCDPVLTANVANVGGPAAYVAQGSLSESPADYTSMDTPAGLQAYFNANDGGPYIGSVSIPTASGSGPLNITPNTSPTAKPFSYAYSLIVDGTTQDLNGNLLKVQELAHPWLSGALALSIMVVAVATVFGKISINGMLSLTIRATLVALFASPNSIPFTTFVVKIVLSMPSAFSAVFSTGATGPTAVFDDAHQVLWATVEAIFVSTPASFKGAGIIIILALVYAIGVICLAALFIPFIGTMFLLLLMIVFGPIVIVAALFRVLDRWLMGYVDVLAFLLASLLAIDIVLTIYTRIIVQMMGALQLSAVGDNNVPPFVGLVGILGVMSFTVWKYLLPMLGRVFAGSGLGVPLYIARQYLPR